MTGRTPRHTHSEWGRGHQLRPIRNPRSSRSSSRFGGEQDSVDVLLDTFNLLQNFSIDTTMLLLKIESSCQSLAMIQGSATLGTGYMAQAVQLLSSNRGGGLPSTPVVNEDCCGRITSLLDTIVGQLVDINDAIDANSRWAYASANSLGQMKNLPQPSPGQPNPSSGVGMNWSNITSRLVSLAVGAAGYAANPTGVLGGVSAAGGIAGALIGGPFGIAIATATAALSGFATAAISSAESLRNYNGEIFSVMTQFDFFMMGFKFRIAQDIAPAIVRLVSQLENLITAIEPLIANIINLSINAIIPAIDWVIRLSQGIQVVLASAQLLSAWVEYKTGVNQASAISNAGAAFAESYPIWRAAVSLGIIPLVKSILCL